MWLWRCRKLPGELFAEVGECFLFQASDGGLDIVEDQKAFGKGVYLTDQAETRSDLYRCKTLQIIHDIAWYVLNFLPIYMPASLLVFVDLFWISFLPLFVGVKFWHDSHGFGKERITHRTRLTKRTESAIHSGDSHINCVTCKSFEDQPILSPECAAFAIHCGTSSMLQALSTASWSAPPVEHVCRYKAGTSGRATGEEHKEHPNQW
jgi:hypothetical protein